VVPDLVPTPVHIPVEVPIIHRQLEPANLHIPAPLLPPELTAPTPATPPPTVTNRLRDAWPRRACPRKSGGPGAWDWLTKPTLQPAPAYVGLAWALR
jgi:hypothetical protein